MHAKRTNPGRLHDELEACVSSQVASPTELASIFDRFSNVARGDLHHVDRRRMLRDLPTRFQHLSRRVTTIRDEGRRLDTELDALSREACALPRADGLTLDSFRRRARTLIDDLRRLDSEETDLLQTAYWRVNGGSG